MIRLRNDAIDALVRRGILRRTERRGWYGIGDTELISADNVERYLLKRVSEGYEIDVDYITIGIANYLRGAEPAEPAQTATERPLRTIRRNSYHGGVRNIESALARIPYDYDGVRRSYGLEYEIYNLTERQESDLAYLLDELPPHVCERDGSLGSNGVEIVFMPMSASQYVQTVKKLGEFVRANNVTMYNDIVRRNGSGMHTTYGVSNYEASIEDLQIRINRFALALRSVATKSQLIKIFGRSFGNYRELPSETTTRSHANAFSTNGRPRSCWECRLPNWEADPIKMVEFFRITESAFHRPFNGSDLIQLVEWLGTEDGE